MNKRILLIGICSWLSIAAFAQTWDGSASTDWNTPANWSTNAVPLSNGNVTIPGSLANYPVLANNVTVNSIDMATGSSLDFKGFNLTINTVTSGFSYFTGATLNNTSVGTDIAVNIITAPGYNTYLRSTTVNDNITFTISGTAGLYEADNANTGNHYTGNLLINFSSTGALYLSNSDTSLYDGNLTINRTGAGITDAFNSGGIIGGNFSFTNNTSGNSLFGISSKRTTIAGTVNIAINDTTTVTTTGSFELIRIINQTSGGTISVQNTRGFDARNDTLKVSAMNITGYRSNDFGYLYNNSITGNVTIADAATHVAGYHSYIRENIITGNAGFTINSTTNIYEADAGGAGNHYTGNVNFTMNGTGALYLSNSDTSLYDGNLTINRTGAGVTDAFNSGGIIGGNFSFTNNTSGNSLFGISSKKTTIAGTVNIAINDTTTVTTTGNFELIRLINQTSGGTINVQNTRGFDVRNDTLKVSAMNITGYRSNDFGYLYNNSITGNVTIADAATHVAGYHSYIRENIITGNTGFTINSTTNLYEADAGGSGNHYTGNVNFTMNGTGALYLSGSDTSLYDGNLTINRTGAGITDAFNSGGIIGGNFSFTNNTSGNSLFGISSKRTTIAGTVNIAINDTTTVTTTGSFELIRIINQTSGGTISVQNTRGFDARNDTLKVSAMNITGYRSNDFGYLYNNDITGNVTIADAATHVAGYHSYIRENIINGNAGFTINSTTNLYDADAAGSGNKYIGDVTYTRNGGLMTVGTGDTTEISQNLTLNSSLNITLDKIKLNGTANGVIEQSGIQPTIIANLIMEKSGTGKITLNDSVTISSKATFTNGNIITSTTKELVFDDNATHSGASSTSHVIGPVIKVGNDIFTFPVGGPVSYNSITMSAPTGTTSRFKAEYKNQNPTIDGYNTNNKAGSFGTALISNAGYWDVQRITGATNVTLTLGFNSNPYEQYPLLANLKVAHWNGTQWDDHGNGGTTGTSASGTVVNSVAITSFSPFAIAGIVPTYFFVGGQPGPGPDGSPIKLKGIGGWPGYTVKQLPSGSYTTDSIFLVPNGSTTSFRLKDIYGVEKDTAITAPASPGSYISANGNGSVNFTGWRHFVYMKDGSGNMMGAIRDNDLTLGNTTMNTYFSAANVSTAPNGNIFLKRSFKITSQFAPAGIKRVRFYVSKTEFTNLVSADPTSFPAGINSLTIAKYTGPQEDSLFNPIPGGNTVIIPNSDITIADLGTMYSLDIDVAGFSGFYIGGNQSNVNICTGSTISLPSNIAGTTYQWQVDNGSGYTNVSNSAVYSGATTKSLTLTSAPGSMYGYKLRCQVNGNTYSQEYTLKFTAEWQGTVSNLWSNTANWSCGILPDANTDVILNAGKPNFPQLSSSASIRSLKVTPGATITVKTGAALTILK